MSALKYYWFFTVILIVSASTAGGSGKGSSHSHKAEPCPDGDICWVMQAHRENRKQVGEECSITRIISNDTENPTTEDPGLGSGGNSTNNSTVEPSELEPPEEMVIDECQDEENRSFMECVLNYNPDITESDADYHKGVCMCYRDWSINSNRSPAYNHVN